MPLNNPEVIELAKFEFNTDAITKGAQELKKAIDETKKAQADLRADNRTSSKAYVENEAALKALNKEYQLHIKALAGNAKQAQDTAIREQKLELVLNQEVRSIQEARQQNKLLNELRNTANLETAKGTEELRLLNQQLDANNEFIKENVDAYTQQKINIGNYKEDIKSALQETNLFSGGVGNLTQNFTNFIISARQSGGLGNYLNGAFKTAALGMWQLVKASVAFIATPVGAVITAIVAAVLLVQNAMKRSEEQTNRLRQAFAPFRGILNKVLKVLEPLGEYLIDGIVFGLQLLEQSIYKAIDGLTFFLRVLEKLQATDAGKRLFGGWADAVADFNDALKESAAQAAILEKNQQRLTDAEQRSRLVQLEYQKDAEKLRQLRDDESKSIPERIAANKQLGEVLNEQLNEELKIAKLRLEVANQTIEQTGKTRENINAQIAALTEIADIEERITGQRSEQLVNENSLRKEAADNAREAADKIIQGMEQELELFKQQQGFRKKDTEERLALAQETADRELEILQTQLDKKLVSQREYEAARLAIENEYNQLRAEALAENALKELEDLRYLNEQKRLQEGYLTDDLATKRQEANNLELQKNLEYLALKLDQGLIAQDEYDKAERELRDTNRAENEAIDKERAALKKQEELALRAIEFEAELARLEDEGAARGEIERKIAEENRALALDALQDDYDNQLISEEVYLARRNQINDQYNRAEAQRDKILRDQKLANAASFLGKAGQLVDKESGAGKAIALAGTAISTYRGIAKEIEKGFPAAIPGIALVTATGLKSAQDILKTDVPSATGTGSAGGGGGGGRGLNLSQTGGLNGQGIQIPGAASDNGVLQQAIEQASGGRQAEQIGEAVREGAAAGTNQGAQEGIVRLSDNRQVAQNSGL